MTATPEYVLNQAHKLVQHCRHTQNLLRSVASWIDQGLYDPVHDQYALKLPGDVVRQIQQLLEPMDDGDSPEIDPNSDRDCDT